MHQSIIDYADILRDYMLLWQELKKCDVAIVWGSVDLSVPVYTAELYHRWLIDTIIFSGGVGRNTDGVFDVSEAIQYRDIAIWLWVPDEAIYVDTQATNTAQNYTNSLQIIEHEWISSDSVMLIHKPYMERRVRATVEAQFPTLFALEPIVTSIDLPMMDYVARGDTFFDIDGLVHMLVWETHRIMHYPSLWFQSPQLMSDQVLQAYVQLIQEGYTKFI